jgi:hypothetical protein
MATRLVSFPITDGTDGGNPHITVTLRNIPIGATTISPHYVSEIAPITAPGCGAPTAYVGCGCGGDHELAPETVEAERIARAARLRRYRTC